MQHGKRDFDTHEYIWALAEQRSRADEERGEVLRAFLQGLGRRLRRRQGQCEAA